MTDATDLWAAVVVSYDDRSLAQLTNTNNRATQTITTAVGEDAALGVINLWPAYAQVDYDASNALHVEVAKRGVIAMLWERGGSATTIAQVEWDEVFTDSMLDRIKRTGPRGRQSPKSSSNVKASSGLRADGSKPRPWSDDDALPFGILPSSRGSAPS